MKGSSVVHGLKSLVHSQLPLNNRESHRLLGALTSSFRRRLDEVHPPVNLAQHDDEDRIAPAKGGVFTPSTHAIRPSAASYADKHLASVLTSPLFVSGNKILDYDSAKTELSRKHDRHPIDLLEDYHAKGAASVPIAELCLESVYQRFRRMSPEVRSNYLNDNEPGRRTFLWLLRSNLHDSVSYSQHVKFIDLMVHLLVCEGREEFLWDWMKLDLQLPADDRVSTPTDLEATAKPELRPYRWRSRLLTAIVYSKLGRFAGVDHVSAVGRFHAAVDVYFMAEDICKSAGRTGHLRWIPRAHALSRLIHQARILVHKRLRNDISEDVDVRRYDKLLTLAPGVLGGDHREIAQLELWHPTKPSTERAIRIARGLFSHSDSPGIASITSDAEKWLRDLGISRDPNTNHYTQADLKWFIFFHRTIDLLRQQGQSDDADWIALGIKKTFPPVLTEHLPEGFLVKKPRHSLPIQSSHSEVIEFSPAVAFA